MQQSFRVHPEHRHSNSSTSASWQQKCHIGHVQVMQLGVWSKGYPPEACWVLTARAWTRQCSWRKLGMRSALSCITLMSQDATAVSAMKHHACSYLCTVPGCARVHSWRGTHIASKSLMPVSPTRRCICCHRCMHSPDAIGQLHPCKSAGSCELAAHSPCMLTWVTHSCRVCMQNLWKLCAAAPSPSGCDCPGATSPVHRLAAVTALQLCN